jgi:hypothetical protein
MKFGYVHSIGRQNKYQLSNNDVIIVSSSPATHRSFTHEQTDRSKIESRKLSLLHSPDDILGQHVRQSV